MSDEEIGEKLVRMESLVTHLERQYEELNKVVVEQGKALAFNRFKGNCLACHYVEGGELTGNYGPPLIAMKVRFLDREVLRAQIWDAAIKNPDTRMPPFGRNRILTEEEIDLVTDYIQSL